MKKNLMVILDRYLNQDGIKLRIGGVVTRDVAHYQGVPLTLPELALEFSKNPSDYADGIARILTVANNQSGTMKALNEFIQSHYQ